MSGRRRLSVQQAFCRARGMSGECGGAGRSSAPVTTIFTILVLMTTATAAAQNLAMSWWTVDGGGGTSRGGTFAVSGTVGQPDAGAAVGNSFAVSSGFWAVTTTALQPTPPPTPTPRLTLTPTATPTPRPGVSVPAVRGTLFTALFATGMFLILVPLGRDHRFVRPRLRSGET